MSDVETADEFSINSPSLDVTIDDGNDSDNNEQPAQSWSTASNAASNVSRSRITTAPPSASLRFPAVHRSAGMIRDDYERRQVRQSAADVLVHAPLVWTRAIVDEESPARVRLRMLRWLAEAGQPGKDPITSGNPRDTSS
ncbi:hypothetical protein BDF22DRAFT_658270 [Syncephalis plumigaleata]|nr:hypothetical protein BDF22DRAFT_658270 [Syncephalis plumigaleata]